MFNFEQSQATVEAVRRLLNDEAWQKFFVPVLAATRGAAIEQLLDPSQKRRADTPDDFLRAQVQVIDAILTVPRTFVDSWDADRAQQQQTSEMQDRYETIAEQGR